MKLIYILLLTFALSLSFVAGADITGFGSNKFFSSNEHNSLFSMGQNGLISVAGLSTISFGSLNEQLVCNLDTSTIANELIVYSGSSVRIYTGSGNTLTLLDSFTTTSNINDIGCGGGNLWVVTNTDFYRSYYNNGAFVENRNPSVLFTNGTQVSCDYNAQMCAVAHNEYITIDRWNETLYYGYLIQGSSSNYDLVVADYNKLWIQNSSGVYAITLTGTSSSDFTSTKVSAYTYNVNNVFGDLNNDGNANEFCYAYAGYNGGTGNPEHYYYCYNSDGTTLNNITIVLTSASGSQVYSKPYIFDLNNDGQNDICISDRWSVTGSHTSCYNPVTDASTFAFSSTSTSTGNYLGANQNDKLNFVRPYSSSQNYYFMIGNQLKIMTGTTTITTNQTISNITSDTYAWSYADITGDGNLEIIYSKSGLTGVVFTNSINEYELPVQISFASNTIDGGFYGFYSGDVCENTSVFFRAQECVGDIEFCNYYNVNTEQERLYVNCGDGNFETGSFADTNPSVSCYYTNSGSYDVTIYIQGESYPNSLRVNNANSPIEINVSNSVTCNGATTPITDVIIGTPIDSGEVQPPTEPVDVPTDETSTDEDAQFINSVFGNIKTNIKTIIALIIIISIVSTLAGQGIRNPVILLLGAVVGIVLTSVLGLIGTGTIVLMVVVIIALFLLSATLFKTSID